MTIPSILEKIKNNESLNNLSTKKFLFIVAFILIFLRILSYAWCSDDAYHAYIMSSNLLAGKGFTPILGIRVNVSTCPLWTLVVTFGMLLWNNPYAIGMIFNLLFSGIALLMLFKLIYKKDDWFVILLTTTAVLCTSKTYLSYTTSGLENAQILMLSSFYLTVLFKNEYFSKKELFKIALLEGLIAFTRMDCALIFAFASAYVFLFRYKKDEKDSGKFSLNKLFQVIPIAILGLLPFILWEMFSWFYYGSFVPNTALAKLNTGFPLSDYLIRGVWYAVKSETWDVFILFIPFCFVLYVGKEFLQNFKIEKFFLTASGVLIYFFYIIYIGGDFMRGRHFLSIFWIALFSFVRLEVDLGKFFAKILMSALVMSVVIAVLFIKVETREYFTDLLSSSPCWFADEHAVYYEHTGLINVLHDYLKRGEITIIRRSPNKGIQWFYGNKQYLSYKNTEDSSYEYRLYDPLLSRLPAIHEKNWRVGHMDRKIPAGYQKTLDTGINYIEDKNLAFYYDKLKFILSGDLFELERLKETVKFNAGVYNNYLLQYIKDNK